MATLFAILFWVFWVGGGCAFIVFCFVMAVRQNAQRKKESPPPAAPEETFDPDYITTRATVIDQSCCVRSEGIKMPKTVRIFTIVFQLDNGEIFKLNVPEETYDGFEIGQVGELTTVDGELLSYILEENAD